MSGLVAFNQMPGNLRAPGTYAEINAGTPPYSGLTRNLLLGRKLASGSAVLGTPVNIGAGDPNALFGAGSMLADMAVFARYFNPTGEIWALPAVDPAGGAAAAGTITLTGTATAAGTFTRYIAGEAYSVGVAIGDTAATVAAGFAAQVNAGYVKYSVQMGAPVAAAAAAGVVTLTANHTGTEGDGIRVEANLAGSDIDPAGLTATMTKLGPPASAGLTAATTGGTLATGTVYVKITYVDAAGESTGSAEASVAVTGATASVAVASPPPLGDATGYKVYASLAALGELVQNSGDATPIGTPYTIDAVATGGAAVPGSDTTQSPLLIGGGGTISVAAALADLGQLAVDWVAAGPYNSAQNLADAQSFFTGSGSGRWSPTVGLYGHYVCCNDGNLSAQTVLGAAHNDPHCSILGTNQYPHPLWSWSAALIGIIGLSKDMGRPLSEAIEIARPLQTLQLPGLLPPKSQANRWALADRESLYNGGISAVVFGADGTPAIDRIITTYQTAPSGVADTTFLGIETMAITEYVAQYLKAQIKARYPRHVLRADNPRNLQGVVTPAQAFATLVHAYTDLAETAGIVQNSKLFAQYLIVEQSSDPNRLDAYVPPWVANQLVVFAMNITVFTAYPTDGASGL